MKRTKTAAAPAARRYARETGRELFDPYVDENGHQHAACATCGVDCSTHPDAGNSLDGCGDCGEPTCPDHREDDSAARCPRCAANRERN